MFHDHISLIVINFEKFIIIKFKLIVIVNENKNKYTN